MMRIAEHLVFGSLAVAGHLAVFGMAGAMPGIGDAPEGPQVVIEAAPVELVALVKQWSEAPSVSDAAPEMTAPEAPPTPSMPQAAMMAPALAALPGLAQPEASTDQLRIDTTAAAPPKRKPEPKVEQAPKAPKEPKAEAKKAEAKPKAQGSAKPAAPTVAPQKAAGGGSQKTLMSSWGKGIMKALARQSVTGRGLPKGSVTLALTIDTSGSLIGAKVARSSGHPALDQAALAAVQKARFPKAPEGMGAGRHAFTLPVASR